MITMTVLAIINGLVGSYLGYRIGKEEGLRMVVAKAYKGKR